MIRFVNLSRQKPFLFAKLIVDQLPFIIENTLDNRKKGNFILLKEEICRVGLLKGKPAFIEIAEELAMQDTLEPLELKEEMCLQIPNEIEDWVNQSFLESYLQEKFNFMESSEYGFHFDLGVVDPLTSVILQLVDDNYFNFQRRANILNPSYKYIGVSNRKIGNNFCVYLTFST